jgi:hypothetical protein
MLSFAAAHLDYLHPGRAQYHRAKYALLNKALHDYRESLSAPITADNCDALLGTANIIQYLMWCDLSFMEGQDPDAPLDLSGDRLYYLSTGVRQIFFMGWPLFQSPQSVFMHVGVLQPCMALEDFVEARGLNWQRHARALMDLYDNPRYQGGTGGSGTGAGGTCPSSSTSAPSPPQQPEVSSPSSETSPPFSPPGSSGFGLDSASTSFPTTPSPGSGSSSHGTSTGFLEGLRPSLPSTSAPPYRVMTLYQSYKEGEAYVQSAGVHDEALMRAAYKRLVARLAVAMAFVLDDEARSAGGGGGGVCPAAGGGAEGSGSPPRHLEIRGNDRMRYVTVFPMMCFGPLLALISSGDSRMLILLYHIYHVTRKLLVAECYWWCKRRVEAMIEAIGRELRSRGLEVCLRRRDEVV